MNLLRLSAAYLRLRWLFSALNVLLLALGIASITVVVLATHQIERRMMRDAEGIDLVVGAKGSPLQLVLSGVYHVDVPTGNIPLAQARALERHPAVKKALPLALGDSFRGYRIVGTSHDYIAHYGGEVAAGELYIDPLEAVLGAEVARATGLKVGDTFAGVHGIAEAGDAHHEHPYDVVGVLKPTGTVLDRLILTMVESVWDVHPPAGPLPVKPDGTPDWDAGKELTALLIQYSSPLAAAMFPRYVNGQGALQAASPAFETARLFRILGVGADVLRAFAAVLIAAAALSVFIALYGALEERRYDLAIMRTLGASRRRLFGLLLLEGMLLTAAGGLLGLALGHVAAEFLGASLAAARQVEITGWTFLPAELWLAALAPGVGLLAALLPAWRAYRTDIAKVLAEG
ncbi:MAG: FtsX-like permease family protein [Pseudomonadota bacterium]